MIEYIHIYFQPIVVLLVGATILSFVGYINWYGDIKMRSVRWIAKRIFRGRFRSDISADHLFMHITTILLLVGLIWVALAIGYLLN